LSFVIPGTRKARESEIEPIQCNHLDSGFAQTRAPE